METERQFYRKCLQVSDEVEIEYQELWKRIGLSMMALYLSNDWWTLTPDSSISFLDLFKKDLVIDVMHLPFGVLNVKLLLLKRNWMI